MLGNCEKMVVIPTKSGEWPQSQILDDQKVSMAASSSSAPPPPRVMEKPNPELVQQQQQVLKCPRCDSSNTKFCYYNNYSLSQPRHFCKACKRYWTRGGTLRNVPVGGGCRKNKRTVKRPVTTTTTTIDTTAPPSSSSSSSHPHQIDVTSTSNHSHVNPLFYGLPSNSCDMNILPLIPRFNSSSGYNELQPQMNSLGLDFASGGVLYGTDEASDHNSYRNGFSSSTSTLLSMYNNSSSIPSTSTTPILSSSSLHQQKFINGAAAANTFQGFASVLEETAEMVASKEEKSAEGQNSNNNNNHGPWPNYYQMEHVGLSSSDPSSLYWNVATTMGTSLLE